MRCRETNPMADIYRCLAFTHTPRQFARFRLYMQTLSKEVLGDLPHHLLMSTLNEGSLLIFEITLRQ